jgi:hypothetical protein
MIIAAIIGATGSVVASLLSAYQLRTAIQVNTPAENAPDARFTRRTRLTKAIRPIRGALLWCAVSIVGQVGLLILELYSETPITRTTILFIALLAAGIAFNLAICAVTLLGSLLIDAMDD